MPRGRWSNFTYRYGITNEALLETRDFKVRDLLVKKLSGLLKNYVVFPYDRPKSNHRWIFIFKRKRIGPCINTLKGWIRV